MQFLPNNFQQFSRRNIKRLHRDFGLAVVVPPLEKLFGDVELQSFVGDVL